MVQVLMPGAVAKGGAGADARSCGQGCVHVCMCCTGRDCPSLMCPGVLAAQHRTALVLLHPSCALTAASPLPRLPTTTTRWLLSASMDGTVRCWDIPSAQCLQAMRLGAPVTALSLSPSMDLLATCHAELRGIYLWSNQMMFGDPSKLVHSDKVR